MSEYRGRLGIPGVHQLLLVLNRLLAVLALPVSLFGVHSQCCAAERAMPDGFVYLRQVVPSIIQDMRYATEHNFTGRRVPGYEAAECILKREAAEALRRAQDEAQSLGLSLKVYDCYRPERAVRAFVAWAAAPEEGRTKPHYPHLKKSQLVPAYIASQSAHSTGAAVDITLVPLAQAHQNSRAREGACTAAASEREADNSLDMGTAFDCFDPKANTFSASITAPQRKARAMLIGIMEGVGFHHYRDEWWHFTFKEASSGRRYDFPIVQP